MWELKGRRGSLELLEWSRAVKKQRNAIRVWPWATETNTGFSKQVIFYIMERTGGDSQNSREEWKIWLV